MEPDSLLCLEHFMMLDEREKQSYLKNNWTNKMMNKKNDCLYCLSMETTKVILFSNDDSFVKRRKPYSIMNN